MSWIDWFVVIGYIVFIVLMSYRIGKKQKNQEDYYLGGKKVPSWQVGMSMAANQVSAISLIGVPAFIAYKSRGGLIWLQYELAIPLAMVVIILVLVPLYRRTGGITIYHYLEKRFGTATRSLISVIFLISRSLATGVALLATAYVTSACVGMPLVKAIVLIGITSLAYTAMGGITADIYSDIIQLAVLWVSSIVLIGLLLEHTGLSFDVPVADMQRYRVFDFSSLGVRDGNTFAFWPMLLGGFFLYISYYGCDQSQAQRLLATETDKRAQRSLLINALVRFPLVLTYSCIGILLIPFLYHNPVFAGKAAQSPPDMLMPLFFSSYVPKGLLGLIVAGIFAASMSSLDSAINSLSAATWEDFLIKIFPVLKQSADKHKVYISRIITVIWGGFATFFAVFMAGGSETVVELVNKIGSAFYGPIAGVFVLGMVSRRADQKRAMFFLILGVVSNMALWIFLSDSLSWMWWNLSGFMVTFLGGLVASFLAATSACSGDLVINGKNLAHIPWRYIAALIFWFCTVVLICLGIEGILAR